jgi:hypothetical protein
MSRQSAQMVVRLSALRTLLPRNIIIFMFLVFTSVRNQKHEGTEYYHVDFMYMCSNKVHDVFHLIQHFIASSNSF